MTANQVALRQVEEQERANRAKEALTSRQISVDQYAKERHAEYEQKMASVAKDKLGFEVVTYPIDVTTRTIGGLFK